MALPGSLDSYFRTNTALLLAISLGISVLLIIYLLIVSQRLAKLSRVYSKLTKGVSGGNLEEILVGYADSVDSVKVRTTDLEQQSLKLAADIRNSFSYVGIVRYDAFEDVGGEQSFSFVLLNAKKTGVAVSSVYSRNDVRVYAKAFRDGKPSHPLTQEELRALKQAEES